METSSSILIILVFSSVFSQIFLSITFSSFPSLFLFPRETSHASPPPPPPLLSNPITSTSTFSLLARLLLEHREKFSSHRAYIFNYHPPPLSIIPLPSQQGSNVPRVSFSCSLRPCSFRHRRCPASALFQIRGGRGEKWSSGSRRGKKRDRKHGNDPRVYVCVCARGGKNMPLSN